MIVRTSLIMVEARRLREAKGLSQDRISRAAGFSHMSVVRWENGRNHPSILSVETYLEALGKKLKIVDIDEASA